MSREGYPTVLHEGPRVALTLRSPNKDLHQDQRFFNKRIPGIQCRGCASSGGKTDLERSRATIITLVFHVGIFEQYAKIFLFSSTFVFHLSSLKHLEAEHEWKYLQGADQWKLRLPSHYLLSRGTGCSDSESPDTLVVLSSLRYLHTEPCSSRKWQWHCSSCIYKPREASINLYRHELFLCQECGPNHTVPGSTFQQ